MAVEHVVFRALIRRGRSSVQLNFILITILRYATRARRAFTSIRDVTARYYNPAKSADMGTTGLGTRRNTKKFRQKYLDKKAEAAASAQATSSPKGSSSKITGLPDRTGSSKIPSGEASPVKLIEEVNSLAARRRKWQNSELSFAAKPVTKSTELNREVYVDSNFFKLQIDSKIQLFKYSIIVEDHVTPINVEGVRRVKKETKSFLTREYLTNNRFVNVPAHKKWALDYDLVIISVGPLYTRSGRDLARAMMLSSNLGGQPPRNGRVAPPPLSVRVEDLGPLDMGHLVKHVTKKEFAADLNDELKALDIICWKRSTRKATQ
ncbi:uncharacterized protein LY89DRAFT_760184 [Mollisia scopiformis]|uniref:Uncharacterized protein n=1 Tax=Mollisia scopiformis TaxID=149040 RepID=A0A132BDB8_MOLSC|nr:uncharacterized protein LY89DRAFT_760184 [Mollisia scopiformis]KUJ10378.1 hypothetical protein LY89DRAFT_760184 [Mollisia scopiformis]